MNVFEARNPKQLDICLKLLYAEGIDFVVKVCEDNKHKIIYRVTVNVDKQTMTMLEEKYRILIS